MARLQSPGYEGSRERMEPRPRDAGSEASWGLGETVPDYRGRGLVRIDMGDSWNFSSGPAHAF